MEFAKILELFALVKKEFGLSDIEFILDSGEGDDDNKLVATVPQTGMIYFYPTCLYISGFKKSAKKLSYSTDVNYLFFEITNYFKA